MQVFIIHKLYFSVKTPYTCSIQLKFNKLTAIKDYTHSAAIDDVPTETYHKADNLRLHHIAE